jgi:uncharacterized Ntn-hydrolase superfamily protein
MPNFHYTDLFSTYSIIARDPETGHIGGAVQTHQMGVGRIIPIALPGVGVVASQSMANISYNPQAIAMLKEGIKPQRIIDALVASDTHAKRRQVAVMNHLGEAAAFSGAGCIPEFGHHVGENYSVQANMMTRPTVIDAMRIAFEGATGDLAARMLAALQAAQAEDGDIRGMQSAALLVIPGTRSARDWETIYNLRVDEHENPIAELGRLVHIRHTQLLDNDGERLLSEGKIEEALSLWERVRTLIPEQEEVAFWQAVTLADMKPFADAVEVAAKILNDSLGNDKRREHWLDLIGRLVTCGLIEREGAGAELLEAINRG